MIEEKAYAKINLSLEVIDKRNDGYHNILSLMAAVEMHDLLKLKVFKKRNDNRINLELLASGSQKRVFESLPVEKNLIYKAAVAYLSEIEQGADLILEVDKNIPSGAGLGGGSADAAAMLRILNREYVKFDLKKLQTIAAKIGADVPFCLTNGFSICEGIGEIIEKINGKLPYSVLIVNNGVHSNTAEAYSFIDSHKGAFFDKNEKKMHFRNAINEGMLDGRCNFFINDFENAVFSRFQSVKCIKQQIENSGSLFTLMTGSGSTVYGLYDNPDVALTASRQFSGNNQTVCITRFLNRATEIN